MKKQEQEPWYVEERAEWFASLVLTEGQEVKVHPYAGHDMAIDLLGEILKNGKSTLRFFGVQIVGYPELPKIQDADNNVLAQVGRDSFEAELPICVFVIGVRKPEGIYRWVVKPVVENGLALLQREVEPSWQTLDEVGIGRLVRQVNAWYDSRNGNSNSKSRGRHAKLND